MTDEQMRIAIHEARGLTVHRSEGILLPDIVLVPNYLSDLNAMHEVVQLKGLEHSPAYEDNLAKVFGAGDSETDWWEATAYRGLLIHATARQRAEAFLRTLNLMPN